jgi:hypothetical protein
MKRISRQSLLVLASGGVLIAAGCFIYAYQSARITIGGPSAGSQFPRTASQTSDVNIQRKSADVSDNKLSLREAIATDDGGLHMRSGAPPTRKLLPERPTQPLASLGRALQSDLELVGPDSDFEEAVHGFAAEIKDTGWSRATEANILNLVSQATGLMVGDIQLECRSTTCRLRLTNAEFEPSSEYSNFGDLVDSVGLELTWLWMGPDQLGNRADLAYLRRKDVAPEAVPEGRR